MGLPRTAASSVLNALTNRTPGKKLLTISLSFFRSILQVDNRVAIPDSPHRSRLCLPKKYLPIIGVSGIAVNLQAASNPCK
jgi:hypothetical protein